MPRAGGQYVYLREAWTPLSGFLYGWTHSLSWVSTSAPTSRMWWFCLWNKCSTRLPTAWLEQCVPSAGERGTLVAHDKNGLDVFKAAQSQGINNSVFESNINTKTNAGFSLPVALRYADHETDFFARVDTGASFCIFQRLHAEAVGIVVESGTPMRISTVAGVLGQTGWLDRMRFGLVDHDRQFYLSH